MSDGSVCIAEMFRGPPSSANGGYATGAFGRRFRGGDFVEGIEVTLRAPVALDRAFATTQTGDGLRVLDGERLIAEVRSAPLSLEVPAPASWDEALAVRERSAALQRNQHPTLGPDRLGFHPICFCCGAELAEDEGLRVFAAPVPGRRQVAAAWSCNAGFAADDGELAPEIVCAALDCPGQFAWLAEGTRTGLLGRLTVRLERPVRASEPCVVIGWTLGSEGKKFFAGTALFDARGQRCAIAKAVWIGRY